MKTAPILFCAAAFIFASVSCGKHSWKETQVLHEKYQKHGDSHAAEGEHGKKEEAKH
ncbi:hypothetical protein [Prosthecobacter sp.]|uniref:hypothetical protein n=1 Tax=Prosthecobacter sp. TaxID=1965333 RepID=UPI002AB9D551|nr:hypothetical protein [Prosthecobacter sp.]MDZ4404723.1 hypothetical protein [Prosthecobacter sp.]